MTRGLIARNVARFRVVMARDLVTRGHLGFCHYERSEVIQKQVLLAKRLLLSLRFFAMTRGLIARNVARFRVVMARDLVTRGHLGFCHYERSEVIQKQMLLESRLRQSLRFFAMTRGVIARNVVRFRVVMARDLVTRGHLGFCHYERSEVIQKQVLLAKRLLLSLRSIAMTRTVSK